MTVFDKDITYYLILNKLNSASQSVALTIKDEIHLTFANIEGISNSIVSSMIIRSTEAVSLPNPTKIGYTFEGWWTSLEVYGQKVDNDNATDFQQPELTLFAKWIAIEYTIIYQENGGNPIEDSKYIIEHAVYLNQDVVRDGFVFGGWYDNIELDGQPITTLQVGNIGDKTYYAKWINEKFTISFDLNATNTDGLTASYNSDDNIINNQKEVYYNQSFSLPTPNLVGFEFDGWLLDGELLTASQTYRFEKDINVIAKWTRKSFYIKVNLILDNGAIDYKWVQSNGNDLILSDDSSASLPFNRMSPNNYILQLREDGFTNKNNALLASLYKNGHIFTAFVHDASGINRKIFDWSNLTKEQIQNGNIIVLELDYAIEKEFKINVINVSGVEGIQGRLPHKNYGEVIDYAAHPTKIGHTFSHYIVTNNAYNAKFTGELAIGKTFNFVTMPDLSQNSEFSGEIIDIEPVFAPISYTVTLNDDGKTSSKSVTFGRPYNISSGNAFSTPTKTGYDFEGWYTGVNGVGAAVADKYGNMNSWNIPNDCTLYARWSYLVSINANGGVGNPSVAAVRVIAGQTGTLTSRGSLNKIGYNFVDWNTHADGTGISYSEGAEYRNASGNITLYAKWIPITYTITYNANGGSGFIEAQVHTYDQVKKTQKSSLTKFGYAFCGWSTSSSAILIEYREEEDVVNLSNVNNGTITLYAIWHVRTEYFEVSFTCDNTSIKDGYKETISGTEVKTIIAGNLEGYTFSKWYLWAYDTYHGKYSADLSFDSTIVINIYSIEPTWGLAHIYLEAIYTKNCVAEGSLITLADGSQKPVELLTGNEQLLVWNLKTGSFDVAPIVFIDSDPSRMYEVINLSFSDGTTVKVISEHAFWDIDLNRYVYLRSDAAQYIGHWFNKQTIDVNGNLNWTAVQLTHVIVANEVTTAWSPVTAEHLCYYVNGMLSMPGGITGLFNIFDVNAETMQYDQEAMQADIVKYGLFTYEEFSEIISVPREIFDAFDAQYFKVAIGKGLITVNGIMDLIERYADNLTAI